MDKHVQLRGRLFMRPGPVGRVTRGFLLLCSYVFLEDEAGQQGGGLLHRQVVEEAVEDHLRQQELVAARDTDAGRHRLIKQPLQTSERGCVVPLPADFTGHPSFHLDDIRGAGEAQPPQDSLPALELVHLQDGLSLLQLPLGCPNICSDLNTQAKKSLQASAAGIRWSIPFIYQQIRRNLIYFTL